MNSSTNGGRGEEPSKRDVEVGAIRPSQSAWCNAVVLVRKKDGGLHFYIDF